jgi:hypothetical protein
MACHARAEVNMDVAGTLAMQRLAAMMDVRSLFLQECHSVQCSAVDPHPVLIRVVT